MAYYFSRYRSARKVRKLSRNTQRYGNLISALRNPFATRTIHPVIPDGKTHISSGQRIQAVQQVNGIAGSGIIEMFLFPGLNSCMTYRVNNGDAANVGTIPFGTTHAWLTSTSATTNSPSPKQQSSESAICSWRTVSCGARISLINNAETNEGWFEACRINVCDAESFSWRVAGGDGTGNSSYYISAAKNNGFVSTEDFGVQNLALSPSFVSGKLRDLHKYTFRLNANTNDREFVPVAQPDDACPVRNAVDVAMDCIYIRVHGSAGTKLMTHIVSNQEIIYDENTALYRTSTRTGRNDAVMNTIQRQAMVPAATATPMTGVTMVSPGSYTAGKRYSASTPIRRKKSRSSVSRRLFRP